MITYENVLAVFRNQVNHKILPELSSSNKRGTTRINESGTHGGGRGARFQIQGRRYKGRGARGIFGGTGRGRSGRGYGIRVNNRHSIKDPLMLRCNYGSQLEVHPSYDFTNDEWNILPEVEIISIIEEREWYKILRTNRYGGDTS